MASDCQDIKKYLLTYALRPVESYWFRASGLQRGSEVSPSMDQPQICIYIHPDAVPPIHVVISYHVATDKPPPAQDGDKFRSIFSDNLQPIASRGKKARGTLLVDHHCGNGCSNKRASLPVSYHNEISGGHFGGGGGCSEEVFCRPSTARVGPTTWNSLPPAPELSENAFIRAMKTNLLSTARHR